MDFEDIVFVGGPCDSWHDPLLLVHISQMTAKIAGLGKSLTAQMAVKRSHLCVLTEVVSQITTLAKLLSTSFIFTPEV